MNKESIASGRVHNSYLYESGIFLLTTRLWNGKIWEVIKRISKYLSFLVPICLSISFSHCLSIYLSTWIYLSISIYQSIYLYFSVYLSIYLSIYLSLRHHLNSHGFKLLKAKLKGRGSGKPPTPEKSPLVYKRFRWAFGLICFCRNLTSEGHYLIKRLPV